jgi:uncharacterized protein DUF4345
MEKSIATTALLAIAGITAIVIGGALLFVPAAFQASVGITLADNINLLSETRASGGSLLSAGILIALGALSSRMVRTSLLISSLFYLSYGAARVLGMIVDGIPHNTLVAATGYEIVIGLLSLFMLLKVRRLQYMD